MYSDVVVGMIGGYNRWVCDNCEKYITGTGRGATEPAVTHNTTRVVLVKGGHRGNDDGRV